MATAARRLTREDFQRQYDGQKPYWEYWHGEAIQKTMATLLHGLLQRIIMQFLISAGYESASEVELRINLDWNPVPDVIGCTQVQHPYPTKPLEIVVEILSPDDRMDHMLRKCSQYARIGIERIYVLNPDGQEGWEWNIQEESLGKIASMQLPNGDCIHLAAVWDEMNGRMSQYSAGRNQRSGRALRSWPTVGEENITLVNVRHAASRS